MIIDHDQNLLGRSWAGFSPCRQYRYRLERQWSDSGGRALWVMLNPSTADAFQNDPTVERCQRRSVAMGCGRFGVVNIFAYRSTDPTPLKSLEDPVGPLNDEAILAAAADADIVIAGWGNHGAIRERGHAVYRLLRDAGVTLHALQVNEKTGQPKHPLYVGYEHAATPFEMHPAVPARRKPR